MGRKTNYTPSPVVAPDEIKRLAAIVEVLAGIKTVSEAARSLALSRNHFQTILHRGVEGLVGSIRTKPPGRSKKTQAMAVLEKQVAKLKRENARLQQRVGSTERLLTVAGGLLQGRIRPRRRSTKASAHDDDGDPDPALRHALDGIDEMRTLGVDAPLAAAVVGVHPATVRRWRVRMQHKVQRQRGNGPEARVSPETTAQVNGLVRELKGLVGADALRHSVAGLSRRQAAWLKTQVLMQMERERKDALTRVTVTTPGVVRGMDGVHYRNVEGPIWALIAADGAVPFRTSVTAGRRYDATLVAKALLTDMECNGAPIVYRMDRAAAHDEPRVRALLDAHQVLMLHGPPRCPRYYGQLERQNREHRAWSEQLLALADEEIEPCLRAMLEAINGLWRRRRLAWQTAAEVWRSRPRIDIDRQALREEVMERATRIARTLEHRGKPADLAERLAIERTLELRGYLQLENRGWC